MSALSSPTLPILKGESRLQFPPQFSKNCMYAPDFYLLPFEQSFSFLVYRPLSTTTPVSSVVSKIIECHFVFVLFRSICGFTVWLNSWRFINYLRLFIMGNLISITKYFVFIPLDCFITDILRTKNATRSSRVKERRRYARREIIF